MIKLIALIVNIISYIAVVTITIDGIRKQKKQYKDGCKDDWKDGLELPLAMVFMVLSVAIFDTIILLWLLKDFSILQLIFMFIGCLLCNLGLYCSIQPCEYMANVLPGFLCFLLGFSINGIGICLLT